MHAFLVDAAADRPVRELTNTRLASDAAIDEKWLQNFLFSHPTIVPIDQVDPGGREFIPVCRELSLPKDGGSVFLDVFGFTSSGRPVLIECKLWRNPQARREVVAQILEYAALLQQWSYSDLTARVLARLGQGETTVLFDIVRAAYPETDEAQFVDTVSRCLTLGDFDLIIAGDGIRSDLHVVADYLKLRSGLAARLALVEFQVWSDPAGTKVVLPSVALRTEVITHTVLVSERGTPLPIMDLTEAASEVETREQPQLSGKRRAIRAFWDDVIARARFDHPDQPAPRHGGLNWIRLDVPPDRLTAYRTKDTAGIFLTLFGEGASGRFDVLLAEKPNLERELGFSLTMKKDEDDASKYTIAVQKPFDTNNEATYEAQKQWLLDVMNRFVSAFRPRLAQLSQG
ncbi:MAG: DUF4268 domain-containing protein [Enhydrobacter sp.]|nr:MAG: DUF4268 domain-containing protein [Enhydrobacter sp.]